MMKENTNVLSAGWRTVSRHKRFIFWFWLLNLTLAEFGSAASRARLHTVLDHSLLADRLLHGFDLGVYFEMVTRPDWGPVRGAALPAMYFSFLFFLLTLFCLPGVLEAYTSEGKLSREEFFRVCGHHLWRFIRVLLFFAIIASPIAGVLFSGHAALGKAAHKSTNELLPFYSHVITLAFIFLVLTAVRIWFDLAQVDVVVRDQGAVRKSVAAGFRLTRRNLITLLATYVLISVLGLGVLAGGIWVWHRFVPPSKVLGAFLVTQVMLILWLAMRFWQRASAAAFYMRVTAVPVPVPVVPEPVTPPVLTPPIVPSAPAGAAPA
jgi:hypothetical protein